MGITVEHVKIQSIQDHLIVEVQLEEEQLEEEHHKEEGRRKEKVGGVQRVGDRDEGNNLMEPGDEHMNRGIGMNRDIVGNNSQQNTTVSEAMLVHSGVESQQDSFNWDFDFILPEDESVETPPVLTVGNVETSNSLMDSWDLIALWIAGILVGIGSLRLVIQKSLAP